MRRSASVEMKEKKGGRVDSEESEDYQVGCYIEEGSLIWEVDSIQPPYNTPWPTQQPTFPISTSQTSPPFDYSYTRAPPCPQLPFTLLLLLFTLLLTPTRPYPPSYLLTKNPHISRQTFSLTTTPTPTITTDLTSPPYPIPSFVTSDLPTLQPLICISAIQEYNYQEVDNVISFMVRVKVTDYGPVTGDTTYVVVVGDIGQVQGLARFDLQVLFFSKELQAVIAAQPVPMFYSFNLKLNEAIVFQGSDISLFEFISLPQLLGDEDFSLPDTGNGNYDETWFMTGLDESASIFTTQLGMNSNLNIQNSTCLKLQLNFNSPVGTTNQPIYLRSVSFSVFIFHNPTVKSTQHFVQTKSPTVMYGYSQLDGYSKGSLELDQGEWVYGMETFVLWQSLTKKINFQAQGAPSSDNRTIDLTINSATYIAVFQAQFLYIGWVIGPPGQAYQQDATGTITWSSITACPVHYYQSPQRTYNLLTCLPCISACQTLPPSVLPTCLSPTNTSHSCTPCSDPTPIPQPDPSPNPTVYFTCTDATIFGDNCTSTTSYQECTVCKNGTVFVVDRCVEPPQKCGDFEWREDEDEQCDSLVNDFNHGCMACKKVDGFVCNHTVNPADGYGPSQCHYTHPISLTFTHLTKQQFTNTLTLTFKLTPSTPWTPNLTLNESVFLSSPDQHLTDLLPSAHMTHLPSSEELVFVVVYDGRSVENLTLGVEVELDSAEVLKGYLPLGSEVKLEPRLLEDAFFMDSHETWVYTFAVGLAGLYKLAAVGGFGFVLAGFLGGKYIVLEVLAVLQITFLGLLQIDRYTPSYLSINRLSIIADNFLHTRSAADHNSQLNTLKMHSNFEDNFNVQIGLFALFLAIGFALFVYSKLKRSQSSILAHIAGMTFLCEYCLYGLLVFSYLASTSLGLEVRFQFVDKVETPNYLSLGLGSAYVLALIVYVILYVKKRKYFGEFSKEMEKFSINEFFICFLVIEKLVIGFLLGLLSSYRYIGFSLALMEAIFLVYIMIKQPFYYHFHATRLIINYCCVILILCIYNVQKLYFENYQLIDSSPWLFVWPLFILVVIYWVLIKNAFSMVKQIRVCMDRIQTIKRIYEQYKKYCAQIEQPLEQDVEEALKNIYANNIPEKVELTENQLNIWKNFDKVSKKQRPLQSHSKIKDQNPQQDAELMNPDFRARLQLKRLDRKIKKKLEKELQKKETRQRNLKNNHTNGVFESIEEQQSDSEQGSIQENKDQESNLSEKSFFSRILFNPSTKRQVDLPQNSQEQAQSFKKPIVRENAHEQKKNKKTQKDQVFNLFFDAQNNKSKSIQNENVNKQKMTFIDHWNEIDQNVKKFQHLNPSKGEEEHDHLTKKYEDLEFVDGDNKQVKLPNGRTIPLKNMMVLEQNPILTYYRNQIQTEIHTKVNPFQELKEQKKDYMNKEKQSCQKQEQIQRLITERLKAQGLFNQKKETKPEKKIQYRGGNMFHQLEKKVNRYNQK